MTRQLSSPRGLKLPVLLSLLLLSGAGAGVVQAKNVGADPPAQCANCFCPTCARPAMPQRGRAASDTSTSISRTEGNLTETVPIASVHGAGPPTLSLSATYNSYDADGSRGVIDTVMGYGWTHSYNIFLFTQFGAMFKYDGSGRVTKYGVGPGGTFSTATGYFEKLVKVSGSLFTLTTKNKTVYTFKTIAGSHFVVAGPVWLLTSIVDRNGNTTTLNYTGGNLTGVSDAYGRTITYTYNASNKVSSSIDPDGRVTTYQYDPTGHKLSQITDPNGKTIQYSYNTSNQLTSKVDKGGRTFTYQYSGGEPVSVKDSSSTSPETMSNAGNWGTNPTALAANETRTYTPSTTTSTDGRGNAWTYQYDSNAYLTKITAPDGSVTSYTYDPGTLMPASITDADGHTTTYNYDSQGNMLKQTDALGHVTTYTYEPVYNMMTSVTDPRGRVTTYSYDANGNRIQEVDPLTGTHAWSYDGHGNVLTDTDKDGHTTTYQYDASENLIKITDPLSNITTSTYDSEGNLLSRTDPNGHTTSYQYDGMDRVIKETDALGHTTQSAYDGEGNRVQLTDQNGRITTYQYDQRQRLTQSTDALGHSDTYGYDGNDNRTSTTDRNGHTTTYQYDQQNRMTRETDALGGVTTTTYDGVGNQLTTSDANGHTTTYTYDALNRRATMTDAAADLTQYGYDTGTLPTCPTCGATPGFNEITSQTDANGKVTYFKYDALDRRIDIVQKVGSTADTITPSDAVTTYTYDPAGNKLTTTEPDGNTTTTLYDADNRINKVTNAAGDVTSTTYDSAGNVLTVTEPNLNTTTYSYDAMNRVIQQTDSVGLVATYSYDPVGNRLTHGDGNGNATSYGYDAINRMTTSTDALGQTTTMTYDPVGNLTQTTDRNGSTTTSVYDSINRRTGTTDAIGNTTSWQYDSVGNLTRLTDANGHATQYAYDSVNRRTTETYADGGVRSYAYDGVGNIVTRTDQLGQVTHYTYSDLYFLTTRAYPSAVNDTFTYDLSGRMLSGQRGTWPVTFTYDGADRIIQTVQNTGTISYSYNLPGRTRAITYPGGRTVTETTDARERMDHIDDPSSPLAIVQYTYDLGNRVTSRAYRNGTSGTYSYDNNDWMTNVQHSFGASPITGFTYAYDHEGNKQFENKLQDTTHSEAYQYDNTYRVIKYAVGTLVGSTVPVPGTQTSYNLDAVGNWTSKTTNAITQTRVHNSTNELIQINSTNLTYDADGNVLNDGAYTYTYDEENRVKTVTRDSDSALVGQYQYDALSRRVEKIANPAGSPVTTVYFCDDQRDIEEQDGGAVTQATYVYGNRVDELLTMNRGGQVYYYHQNQLDSIEAITDSTATPVERYAYDAYGQVTVTNGAGAPVAPNAWGTPHSAIGNPVTFTGRQLDEEAGLYYYRVRYYNPLEGRFLQRDPAGYVNGSNLYEYVRSNPINLTDPSGLVLGRVSSKVEWEYKQRYLFSTAWRWAGDTVVNTKLDVEPLSVTYLESVSDVSPVNYYKNSYSFTGHNLYFASSGFGKSIGCPCINGERTKGVYVYHLHVAKEDNQINIDKITAGVSAKVGDKDVGEIGANVGVELKVTNPDKVSTRWFEATICPDGRGGFTIGDKDTSEASVSFMRGTTYRGIVSGNQYARGHAK